MEAPTMFAVRSSPTMFSHNLLIHSLVDWNPGQWYANLVRRHAFHLTRLTLVYGLILPHDNDPTVLTHRAQVIGYHHLANVSLPASHLMTRSHAPFAPGNHHGSGHFS